MARRKKPEEAENHERWLVSYADFITLLFAFFVVLYATSSQNEEKEKKFEDSIRSSFRLMGGSGERNENGVLFGQVFDPLELVQRKNIGNSELEDSIEQILRKNMSQEERAAAISDLRHDATGVRISLSASTFFPSGSSKLRLPALESLDKIARILKLANRQVVVEGHTDDQQLTGGNIETNWELGSLRATSVVRYLIKFHQMDAGKLAAASYADQRPLVPNDSEKNRSKNRRIELLIMNE
jgi:chemotaxis protein MotB